MMALKQLSLFSLLLIGAGVPDRGDVPPDLNTKMVVFSDPHYYDPSLGTAGSAFDKYISMDRKLLREAPELLEEAIQFTLRSDVDIVLVPGDLTKDGTLVSHLGAARYFARLEQQDVSVLVVPGNHDIDNGEAYSFHGDSVTRVENVDARRFSEIYGQFGFREAISRDSFSLSYLAEPVEDLWVLALDACLYDLNDSLGHPHTGGEFKPETLEWMKRILQSEEAQKKLIIAMMHHGIMEHFRGQSKYFNEYLVKGFRKVSGLLAGYNVTAVFTGHYHANDITAKHWGNGKSLYDVQTGSLVTWPCPLRVVLIADDSMHITTHHITSIPSFPTGFPQFAAEYVKDGVSGVAEKRLTEMNLRPEDATRLSSQIGDAFLEHYRGDEIPKDPPLDLDSVNLKGRLIISFRKKLVKGLYHDLPPSDNNLSIHLRTGS